MSALCKTRHLGAGCAIIGITPIRATRKRSDMLRLTQPIQYNNPAKSHLTALVCSLIGAANNVGGFWLFGFKVG